ncbi:MAG: cell envelope integrity protein CreD [Lewinellaceae bacterium]|nr:cell envelope integrity protein CreD [Saprospiraceae bacterium]MCB9340354.1 cell envelope integrity protein CreD [Lewinellaceae bacterium]
MNNESTNQPNIFQRFTQWLKESLIVKLLSIGFIVILLLIPNVMISELIRERQHRQDQVKQEVSQSWGGAQAIRGPLLSIPYSTWQTWEDGKRTETRHTAWFLPKKLVVDGDLKHQIRRRSIFDVVLYQAEIKLTGEFEQPDFQALHVNPEDVHWDEARLSTGISGMTGIKEAVMVQWAGQALPMEPGTSATSFLGNGVSSEVPVDTDGKTYPFSIPLKLNGSENLSFDPVGKATTVNLRSDWHSPSFEGAFLPDQREITPNGFTAQWQVLDLNRPYPQQWKDEDVNFGQFELSVRLIQPVDEYLKNTRSSKYAILVVGLTFLLYFFFEVLQKLLIHPFQYLLVGLALTVFYLLLLSLSEHVGFNAAYLVSSVATIVLIAGYSFSVLKIKRLVVQLLLLLVAIYGFIFILLQLEDYALLAGSAGVFLALASVMWASRKIDWYNLGERSN